jgi:hypothetical protein
MEGDLSREQYPGFGEKHSTESREKKTEKNRRVAVDAPAADFAAIIDTSRDCGRVTCYSHNSGSGEWVTIRRKCAGCERILSRIVIVNLRGRRCKTRPRLPRPFARAARSRDSYSKRVPVSLMGHPCAMALPAGS